MTVLTRKQNSKKALELLEKLSIETTIIMRKRGWRITLFEFYPKNKNLLGLNINRKIVKIRLRHSSNENRFLEYHDLIGTMLHELVHMQQSPHDAIFYKILDELYKEWEIDMLGGVAGNVLGGRVGDQRSTVDAAEKRRYLNSIMGSRKLGGKSTGDLKTMVREAAEKRARDAKWCGVKEEDVTVPNQNFQESHDNIDGTNEDWDGGKDDEDDVIFVCCTPSSAVKNHDQSQNYLSSSIIQID